MVKVARPRNNGMVHEKELLEKVVPWIQVSQCYSFFQ